MSRPWSDLAAALLATDPAYNVYAVPPAQVVTPAVVIRPDEPWVEPDRFTANKGHYLAIAVAAPADLDSAYDTIAELIDALLAVVDGLELWAWVSTSAPILDQSTGSPFIAAAVRLTYGQAT